MALRDAPAPLPKLQNFLLPFVFPVLIVTGAYLGGLALALTPIFAWFIVSYSDRIFGENQLNTDPDGTAPTGYALLTLIWVPVQFLLLFGTLYYATQLSDLSSREQVLLMITLGVVTGGVGIVFAHELMHQRPQIERQAADLLMTMVLYGHFRSEHLLVHHRYVATPADSVSARYNEGIHRFLPRAIIGSLMSSFRAERKMLTRKGLPFWHRTNPFWKYTALQLFFLALAYAIAGGWGVALFVIQAGVAILHLELVNYVEHYGLTRKHLGEGKYEHVKPHHSWNSDLAVSNYLLINLQRHSDHHYKPNRRFPLLQTYSEDEAPQLPFGYPLMTLMATCPPIYKKVMNKRVKAWRRKFYPEIEDWHPYNKGLTPKPTR